jgi:hypothetical protein
MEPNPIVMQLVMKLAFEYQRQHGTGKPPQSVTDRWMAHLTSGPERQLEMLNQLKREDLLSRMELPIQEPQGPPPTARSNGAIPHW